MARVWFLVVVLVLIQNGFAEVCNKNILNCDECTRCRGHWCNSRANPRCSFNIPDTWCSDIEKMPSVTPLNNNGVTLSPSYAEKTLGIGENNKLNIRYKYDYSVTPTASLTIINTTQSFDVDVYPNTNCKESFCTTTITASPGRTFCSMNGTALEHFYVKVQVENITEEAYIKFYVPCACSCSQYAEKKSPKCSGRGEFSCGICTCENGWKGPKCEKMECSAHQRRGDVPCSTRDGVECFGNGYCGQCDTCICDTDKEGSQYFDQENDCIDLCSITNECNECLSSGILGKCTECSRSITVQSYNKTVAGERDGYNRTVWVNCNVTAEFCGYVAMATESKDIYVMINPCNGVMAEQTGTTKVPIILGVLGIIAAVAAIGGVMLWKHLNAVPPLPLTDPQYQNIDAQESTGENPLYKSPTSTYKNPLYNKW